MGLSRHSRAICFGVFTLAIIAVFPGCEPARSKPQPIAQKKPEPDLSKLFTDTPLSDPEKGILLSDLRLAKSRGMVNLPEDLRPYWVVTGRVKNDTAMPVKNIHLHITLTYKKTGEEVDSGDLTIKNQIAAEDTISFMQMIQLLPPDQSWEWQCSVTAATTQYFE